MVPGGTMEPWNLKWVICLMCSMVPWFHFFKNWVEVGNMEPKCVINLLESMIYPLIYKIKNKKGRELGWPPSLVKKHSLPFLKPFLCMYVSLNLMNKWIDKQRLALFEAKKVFHLAAIITSIYRTSTVLGTSWGGTWRRNPDWSSTLRIGKLCPIHQ